MANKKQFPKDFPKKVINNSDVILVADTAGNPALITVGDIGKDKVDKENNKSLVLNTDITKLQGLPTNSALNTSLLNKVDKVEGKGLSKNDYTDNEKAVVAKIKTSGSDNKYLNENGEYKEVIVPKAPLQSISVDNEKVVIDSEGNANIYIPDAPVQSIEVNGTDVAPDANGKVSIEIPKAPVQSISLNQNPVTPDSAGNVNIEVIQNVEQTINPASTDPVSSQAVASAFAQLNSKYGTQLSLSTIGEEEDKKYSISLLDEEGNVLSTTEEFSGGGAGAGATTKIVLTKLTQNTTVKKGDEVKLQYQYDHIDTSSDSSTGNTGKAIVSVISGALNVTTESIINAGSINTIDVTKNLQIGNNSVKVRVEVNTGESIQVSTITYTILVVSLQLNSNMDIAQTYVKGAVIYVPFTLQGAGVKTLKTYVKGTLYETRTITQSSATGTISIPTNIHNHGNLSIQLVAELDVTSNVIQSNSIFYDVAIIQTGNNTPIVCTRFDYGDGRIIEDSQRPTIIARQFEDFNINYAVFDPKSVNKQVTVAINNSTIATSNISFSVQKTTYKSVSAGTFSGKINTGTTDYIFGALVDNSDVDLEEPTDELIFKFSASGKSNNDINKETWLSNSAVTATLNNFKFGGDGWLNNALKITDDAKAIINYQPLNPNNRNINNSFTYQIKYKISEVTDENAILISCVDSEGTGFVVTANEAKMLTKGKATVSMKMAEGNVYNIAFVSHPVATDSSSDYEKLNSNMLYLFIDGIMSAGVQRGTGDDIYQSTPTNIVLGGTGATIEIFNTRHYNRYLSDSQALDLSIVDLDSVDDIVKKYDANAIIDGNGNITVDSIADDMRYVIVTGVEANGVATLMQAAVTNNKSTKYNVTEILHVKKSEPNLNFRLIGGYISLQGTSSLAYPIKNYKIGFKNKDKVAGQLYTGCDSQGNGGELQASAKWSFKNKNSKGKLPAKVDLWCLKADFAESSSSHNTGMTALTNDALVATNSLTPAQKYVDSNYAYDVRTTVDGEPCYLFYRKTLQDTPTFLGKYNWNNDKATESVFGFVDIPGYHLTEDGTTPSAWITEKFNGESPVQCWEFLNNDFLMGSYLDDDFDTKVDVAGKLIPNWTRVFESRFPDNQDIYADGSVKPIYLERFVKWVKSTQNNPTKFKAELKDYMDVKHLCDYYMFTDLLGAVDQRIKNCMLSFFYNPEVDKVLGYYIFYDGDTILSIRNDSRIRYGFDIDENSIDPELTTGGNTVYAFAGHNSVLWKNLREQFATELQESYVRLRAVMTNDVIFNAFDKNQSDKYVERVYNIDAQNKYVLPKTIGIDVMVNGQVTKTNYSYMESLQGSRKSHRKWWLSNRLNLFDAKYSTGQYQSTPITFKGYSVAGAKVKATVNRDYYLQLRREGTVMTHSKVLKNAEWSYTYNQDANIGTIFTVLGSSFMSKLNLSEWGGFTDLNFPTMPVLQDLILGGGAGKTYSLTELVIGNKLSMLKFLDIRNYTNLPSLDLAGCTRLTELNAVGCNTLSSINFADGAPITKISLPANLSVLKLNSFKKLSTANILFPQGSKVKTLIIENSPLIDWEALFNQMSTTLKNIRITGIAKIGTVDWLLQFLNVGGVTESGTLTNSCSLVGTYQLLKFIPDEQYSQLVSHFPELVISQPVMSTIKYTTNVADPKNITNLDNNTGYGTGAEYVANGHVSMILNKRYRCLGKQTSLGNMLITPLDNNDGRFFKNKQDATPYQNGSHGDVYIYEPHYWYKGVNDFKNNANYACYSSNAEKPKAYEGRTLILNKETFTTFAGRENAPIPVSYRDNTLLNYTAGDTVLGSYLKNGNGYFVYGMKVEGFKQIRFPAISSDTIMSVVTTDGAELTSNVWDWKKISGLNVAFSNGMYYVLDIPTYCKWVFITFTSADAFDKVVLTDSTNILDVEPEWIEHKESLVSTFDVSYFTKQNGDNILKSYPSNKQVVNNLSYETFNNYIGDLGRKLQMADYEEFKNITNLFFAKYGNRNSQLQNGYGQNSFTRTTTGSTLKYGMMDSAVNTASGNLEYCVFNVKNSDGTIIKVVNNEISCMGYEDLYGGVNEWCAGITTVGNYKVELVNNEGVKRQLRGYTLQNGQYPQAMHNALYMDIIPAGTTTAGTSDTYYCDTVNIGNVVGNVANRGGQSGQSRVDGGIVSLTMSYTQSQTVGTVTARLMFRGGVITKTENVTTFINATEIA